MDKFLSPLLCATLAVIMAFAGAVGMAMSFLYLASASLADITAGTSGFVAGAIFMAAGLISLTMLAGGAPRKQHEKASAG